MKKLFTALSLSIVLTSSCLAEDAPPGLKNRLCPAPKTCPEIAKAYTDCSRSKAGACGVFVDVFRKLLPKSDCQRTFDTAPVPAAWLCGEQDLERYIDLLAALKLRKAKKLFASQEFRNILDGDLAEQYKSLAADKKTKEAGQRKRR